MPALIALGGLSSETDTVVLMRCLERLRFEGDGMSAHGGIGRASLAGLHTGEVITDAAAEYVVVRTRTSPEHAESPGVMEARPEFRNFGRAGVAPTQDIYRALGSAWDHQVMLAKLMRRMAHLHRYGDGVTSANDQNFNSRIPAGYTYLGQFAAHDIIRNSSLLPNIGSQETGRRNLRGQSLNLDVLYGLGPLFDTALYQVAERGEGFRTMLRTGAMDAQQIEDYRNAGKCPFAFRDIPRFQQADLSDEVTSGRPDVLIPDSRNDDNAMVAQVTALFHHLHNAVVTRLRGLGDALSPAIAQDGARGLHLFIHARRITTILYRKILRNDLLRHLLSDAIWGRYADNGFVPLADTCSDGVPVEFSHAAYRLGHAMVRMSYVFNDEIPLGEGIRDALKLRSAVRPYKFPPSKNWIADWSRFFDIGERPPQPSRRIGPSYNDILLLERMFANELVGSVPGKPPSHGDQTHLPAGEFAGLLFSDMIRGVVGGLQTLDAMIATLPSDVVAISPFLSDKTARTLKLRQWLEASPVVFSNAELEHLSANPPLLLWLLFEAAIETNGQSLGTLGSVIIGDVFLARLSDTGDQDAEAATTDDLLARLFGNTIPSTMPEIILFTADVLDLGHVMPAFVSTVSTPS